MLADLVDDDQQDQFEGVGHLLEGRFRVGTAIENGESGSDEEL